MNELRIKLLVMVIIDKLLQETIKGTFRFLETKPNQFLKTEKKSDCTLKRSSSFEDKSYASRLHHHSVPHGSGVWAGTNWR